VDVDLRVFPASDRGFAAYVHDALRQLDASVPDDLQASLRHRFPAAVVSAQDESARLVGRPIWYVYRYGSVRSPEGGRWDDPSLPWAILDRDRKFVEVSDALAAIAEVPAATLVGRRLEMFTNVRDRSVVNDILALWEQFEREGVLESSIRFDFADGRPRELAYRLVADEAGPGRHRLVVREIGR
jgi:PAS domain-containing protein